MDNEADAKGSTAPTPGPFPTASIPTIFADAISASTNNNRVVKFYLNRFDFSLNANGTSNSVPVAQVIMPLEAFAEAALFFEQRLDMLISQGLISQIEVDAVRSKFKTP